ncbi:ABC transporter permease [Aneurinibacillus tyrosinisolvens]|uniref:ABC transporter permease n=1 Tax=Aneurinibacillus tyrosinisolvens TaxID=1443435 RepID=UPI0006998E17|nr:iron export ABC transporter permease subunit FetB [Aneurinibacillus tyrosinisolvens]
MLLFAPFLQLTALGFVLHYIFSFTHVLSVFGFILLMILIATKTAQGRGKWVKHGFWLTFSGVTITWGLTFFIWVVCNIIPFQANYVIPMSGMIIGNAMTTISLLYKVTSQEFVHTQGIIESKLALGFTSKQACEDLIKESIKTVFVPTIDTLKTIGTVQIPGMMAGMIVAGANPMEAIRYQIVIMFSLTSGAAFACMFISFFAYRSFFTKRGCLIRP